MLRALPNRLPIWLAAWMALTLPLALAGLPSPAHAQDAGPV